MRHDDVARLAGHPARKRITKHTQWMLQKDAARGLELAILRGDFGPPPTWDEYERLGKQSQEG